MRYYVLRYSGQLPSGFGGSAQGPLITIHPKHKGDDGLLEHEKTHVRQWYLLTGLGLVIAVVLALFVSPALWAATTVVPFLHTLLYKFLRPYRQWCEVQAYRKQIAVGGYLSSDFAATALVNKYDLNLKATEAAALLAKL